MRRDFVANVSHELKTPLTVIGGFAETLADDDLPVEQRRRFAETIQIHARRMQRIVDDLLDLSRIEIGGWLPNPRRGSRDTAGEACRPFGMQPTQNESRSRCGRIRRHPPCTPTDALRQILSNLVENAVRYTPEGGTVTVFSEGLPKGSRSVFRDTGVGIAPDHLPRIF